MTTDLHATVDAGLALLTGDGATDLLATALRAAGGEPERWSVRQVDHQPGFATTVSYSARVRWRNGAVTREVLGATSGRPPPGAARLTDGRTDVGIWRFPFDPVLPALPTAVDPSRVEGLIGARPLWLRLRAYRPMRRAVIEVATAGGSVYLKVVKPAKAEGLHRLHLDGVSAGCPVPAPLGWSSEGVVALCGLPGRTLRRRLSDGTAAPADVDGVEAALDSLPRRLTCGRRRRTWGQRAPHYAEVLAATAPAVADRARAVAAAVDHAEPIGHDVAIHGDFYENQILVAGGEVTGLLDIDTAGAGERLDDLGCLLGHLAVLAQLRPANAAAVTLLGRGLHERFLRRHHPDELARRTAAVVLSLATGPHRVQEPGWPAATTRRVALAERWLDRPATDVWADVNDPSWAAAGPLHDRPESSDMTAQPK